MALYRLKYHKCNKYDMDIIKQGDSDNEVKVCFGIKFKLSVDPILLLKFIMSFGIYLMSLS